MHTRPASPRHQYPQRHLTVLTPPSADSSSDSDAASSSSSWSTPSLQWQQQLVRALLDILPLKERLSLELFSSGFAVPGATKDEVLSYAVAVVLHFKAHPLLSPKIAQQVVARLQDVASHCSAAAPLPSPAATSNDCIGLEPQRSFWETLSNLAVTPHEQLDPARQAQAIFADILARHGLPAAAQSDSVQQRSLHTTPPPLSSRACSTVSTTPLSPPPSPLHVPDAQDLRRADQETWQRLFITTKPQIDDACRQSIVIPAQQALALLNSVNTAASLFNARLSQLMDALEAQACASEAAYADTLSHIAQNMAREEDILRRNISVWHRHLVVPPVTHMRSGKQAVVSCSRKPSFLATHAAVLPGAAPHARP